MSPKARLISRASSSRFPKLTSCPLYCFGSMMKLLDSKEFPRLGFINFNFTHRTLENIL